MPGAPDRGKGTWAVCTMPDPLDTAWRIHASVADWTGKVDTKASFALTLESAILAGVIAAATDGKALGDGSDPAAFLLYWIGVGLLLIAAFTCLSVVMPQLRGRAILGAC